ncbi:MAG: sarcosine oxidase subunit delta [Pseudomonadota bacterium]
MIVIQCPWCGSRSEEEFTCGGESHILRPEKPAEVSDEEWAAYLYQRKNPKGVHYERWRHTYGCRQWFNVARDTVTHEVVAVYRMNEPRPTPEAEGA